MSASAVTTNGALPPSSMLALTTRSAACLSSMRPMPVDPVKEIFRTRSSESQVLTTQFASVVGTTFTTPSGTPAAASSLAMASAVSGVSAAGLSATVHPAASAGAILRVAMAAGKFHGVTSAATPTGSVRDDGAGAAARADAVCPVGAHRLFAEPAEELGGVGHLRARVGLRTCRSRSQISAASRSVSRDHQIESAAQHLGTHTGRCRRPVTKRAVRRRPRRRWPPRRSRRRPRR